MAISIISSVQSMARKLAASIRGSPSSSSSSSDQVLASTKKDLESLERTLRRIQAVLNDAEEREIGDDSVKLWLKELRWVAYDAENVLGEYQYEIRRAEIMTSASAAETSRKRKKRQDDLQVYDFTSVLLQLSIPQRIRDILERFEEISKARNDLQLRYEDGTRRSSISYVPHHSSSHVDESGIFGREDDKEAVIQMLLSDKVGCKIAVVSIVGMGGLGKTTLAQCVYNDPRICQYFDSRGWVCVSEDFDVRRLTGEIIQSITRQSSCGLTQLDALQAKLKEIVDGKKVLVVLDDVWNEKPSFWESLKVPFLITATTTRVLVTTRNESVAKIMQTAGNMYPLGCLPERQCWTLFCHHAFRCQNPEELYPDRLVEVGRKIMPKCGGLPLAVKTLGSLLLHYGTDEESWREVLESEIWELDRAKDDILPALMLSYYRMPTHLKPCFLFTSIYPKDFRFEKDEVIKMWMAQDYILPRGNKRLEDIGSEYFDELQRRSFFLCDDDDSDFYVLHDIVHDLARHVSENEHHSIVLESNGKICPIAAEVRHLFVKCQKGVTTLCQVPLEFTRDLRTLIVDNDYDYYLTVDDDQFEHSVHLRVLKVNYCKRPPYSIGNLKHLCYLDWNGSDDLNDLSSLGHLYNVQTLHLHCEYYFVPYNSQVATKYGSTCSLPSMSDATTNPSQRGICYSTFSKLVDISLSMSTTSWLSLLPFSQLPSLRRLRLESMDNIERVGHENYCYCPLHLGGADIRNSITTNNAGFPRLEELIFQRMMSWKEWSGVMDGDFPCLRKLTLTNCPSLSQTPTLSSSLQTLHISKCNSLKSLPVNNEQVRFPYIEELVFEYMPAWEEWPGLNSGDFPCLRRLTIRRCNKLRSFPLLPSSLQTLHIFRCNSLMSLPVNNEQVRFPYMEELAFFDMPAWEEWPGLNNGDFPCLRRLTIRRCNKLRSFSLLPSSFQTLHISECDSLESLPVNNEHVKFPYMEELLLADMPDWEEWPGLKSGDFPCLRRLTIRRCNKLRRFMLFPSSVDENLIGQQEVGFPRLEELLFEDMSEWEGWSGVMDGDFPCLHKLTFTLCPSLSQIPTLPSSLKTLHISDCERLKSLPVNNEHVKFPYMEEIEFDSMHAWEKWPGLNSRDFPSLRRLTISSCNKLRRFQLLPSSLDENLIGQQEVGFPCLEVLLFEDMSEWEEWSGVLDGDFPCLHKLTLTRCPSLSQIPTLSSSLKTLHIYDCNSLKSLLVNNEHVRFPYMEELVFDSMHAWEEWPGLNSRDFPCLRILTITHCNKLRRFQLLQSSLDENLIGQQEVGFPRLEEIVLEDIPELQQEGFRVGNGYFPCLRRLAINRCQKLQGLPTLSSSLKDLSIKSCWSLTSLTGLQNLTNLESLELNRCPNLHISPEQELPSRPSHVEIADCPLLQEWCNMHQFNCIQKYYGLAELTIYHSDTIIKDLGADNLTSLKRLYIWSSIEHHLSPDGWLPSMIQILEVHSCKNLESLSLHQSLLLLTRLEIWNCPRLTSFDGLHNLPNLEELSLAYCPKLQLLPDRSLPSSLRSLSVIECKELRSLPLLHEKLSSLEKLEVSNCPEMTNMAGLHNLSSLKTFIISQCPGLWLSSDEQLSSMPHCVSIAHCPALRGWCRQQSIPYSQENEREEEESEDEMND